MKVLQGKVFYSHFRFKLEQKMAVTYNFNADSVIASGRVNQNDFNDLRNLIKDEPFSIITDEQLILFYLSCDGDPKFTVETIKEYYISRVSGSGPLLFINRRMDRAEFIEQLEVVRFGIVPTRLANGCGIVIHGLKNFSYSLYNMEHAMAMLIMTLDALVYDDPPPTGLIMLFDMKGVGLLHLTKIRMGLLRTFSYYLQQGLPIKLEAVHVLNTAYFIDKVMAIIKPLLKKDLIEKIHFHPPNMDLQKFTDTVVPMNCLPEDFGGTAPKIDDLHAINTDKLRSMQSYFDNEEIQRLKIDKK